MRKSAINIIGALFLMTSCNEVVVEPLQMGSITLSLSSDIEVEAQTRTAGSVDCSDFSVSISGTTLAGASHLAEYRYGDNTGNIAVPFGTYKVAAQSCTEETAIVDFGCVRYFGESDEFTVNSGATVPVTVTCPMVNAKATLTLDQSFLDDFDDITVKLKVGKREVSLTQQQADGTQEVYFNVPEDGDHLIYTVYATVCKDTDQERNVTYTNASDPMTLSPAKWAKITVKSNHNGIIGPEISVDGTMGENTFTEIIDPDGGTEVVEGDLNLPTILVNTTIDDATVIDCELDVY